MGLMMLMMFRKSARSPVLSLWPLTRELFLDPKTDEGQFAKGLTFGGLHIVKNSADAHIGID